LAWLAAGLRPDEIADRLVIGYRRVDKYVVIAKEKLRARTRDHAVARAVILGLI
jgi:DNA-binding CsgD family transcriptional regulator